MDKQKRHPRPKGAQSLVEKLEAGELTEDQLSELTPEQQEQLSQALYQRELSLGRNVKEQ